MTTTTTTILKDGRTKTTIKSGDRQVEFVTYSPLAVESILRLDGGVLHTDDGTKNAVINGSMSLMLDLGWVNQSQLGVFSELEYDSYGRTAIFDPGVEVRFAPEFVSKIKNPRIKAIRDWDKSWPTIILEDGLVFHGQPHADLSDVIEKGLIEDIDKEKFKAANAALQKARSAIAEYYETIKFLGGELKQDGSYEDYRSWHEIPGVPGHWPTL